jgi:hypothetical protein
MSLGRCIITYCAQSDGGDASIQKDVSLKIEVPEHLAAPPLSGRLACDLETLNRKPTCKIALLCERSSCRHFFWSPLLLSFIFAPRSSHFNFNEFEGFFFTKLLLARSSLVPTLWQGQSVSGAEPRNARCQRTRIARHLISSTSWHLHLFHEPKPLLGTLETNLDTRYVLRHSCHVEFLLLLAFPAF